MPMLSVSAEENEGQAAALEISRLWARATPPGAKAGAVYLDIANGLGGSVNLIGVSSPLASRAEVHESLLVDGMMKMRKRETLTIPAGEQLSFAPGGLHIMLMGLSAPLTEGEEFQVTLQFDEYPELTLQVPVFPVTQLAYPE